MFGSSTLDDLVNLCVNFRIMPLPYFLSRSNISLFVDPPERRLNIIIIKYIHITGIVYISKYHVMLRIFRYLSTLESLCRLVPRDSTSDPSNDCMLDKLLSVPQIPADYFLYTKISSNQKKKDYNSIIFSDCKNCIFLRSNFIQRTREVNSTFGIKSYLRKLFLILHREIFYIINILFTSWCPDVCSKERLFLFKRGLPRFNTTPFPGSLSTDVALKHNIFHILNSLARN